MIWRRLPFVSCSTMKKSPRMNDVSRVLFVGDFLGVFLGDFLGDFLGASGCGGDIAEARAPH